MAQTPKPTATSQKATQETQAQADRLAAALDETNETAPRAGASTINAAAGETSGKWQVKDMNARQGVRRHEMRDGTVIPLTADAFTPVDEEYALVFLKDPSFVVKRPNGDTLPSLPSPTDENNKDRTTALAPDECIAKYEELQDSALLARAKLRPGGDQFKTAKDRKAIVEFLMTAPTKQDLTEGDRAGSREGRSSDDLPADVVKQMLGGDNDPLTGS